MPDLVGLGRLAVVGFPGEHHTVIESDMADDPEQGLGQFLGFARGMITRGHLNA